MNYRHIYHAGGLADIIKHTALCLILKRLQEKEAPFCVIDSHAAIGLYDLEAPEAQKTGEAKSGAVPFMALPENEFLRPLRDAISARNPASAPGVPLRFYPGSPALIRHFLRAQDRLVAIEKHPEDAVQLRRFIRDDPQVQIHQRDAWEALGALIPVPEKRLFLFIDPPFEQRDEMEAAVTAVVKAHARASHALIALWYPIKDMVTIAQLHDQLSASGIKKILRADVAFGPEPVPVKMNGSGMVLINPPWQLDAQLKSAYAALAPLLAPGTPPAAISWITGE